MFNLFGKKKNVEASTVSATSSRVPADPQTTIVALREQIANQEKRFVILVFQDTIPFFIPLQL
jgi:hypothetical protein